MSKLNEKFWSTFLKENNLTPEEVMSVMDSLQIKKELSEKSKKYQDLADSINDTIYDDGFIANVRINKNTIIPLLVRHLVIDETALNEVDDYNCGAICFVPCAPTLALTRSGDEFFVSDKIYIVEFVEDQIEELIDGFNSSDPFEISRADMQIIGWYDVVTKMCKTFTTPYLVESIEPADLTFTDKRNDIPAAERIEEMLDQCVPGDCLEKNDAESNNILSIAHLEEKLKKISEKLDEIGKERTMYPPRILFDKWRVCKSPTRKSEDSFSSTFKFMKLEDNWLAFSNSLDFEKDAYTALDINFLKDNSVNKLDIYTKNKRLVIRYSLTDESETEIIIGLMDGSGFVLDVAEL